MPDPLTLYRQQQGGDWSSDERPHVGSFRLARAAQIIAVAQPTPLSTRMAPVGQLIWHAPHSMQASRLATLALSPLNSKTPWGHTSLHIPHPLHSVSLYTRVLTSAVRGISIPLPS